MCALQDQNDRFYRQKQSQEAVIDRRIISRLFVSYLSKGKGKSARQDILQVIARVLDFDAEDRLNARIDLSSAARPSPKRSPARSSPVRSRARSARNSPVARRVFHNPVDAELY